MRSTYLAAISCVCALASLPQAQTAAPGASQAYRENITGTVVSFEMVPVPGGTVTVSGKAVQVKPLFIARTEVTWDLYDVFSLGLDVPKGGADADAIARPSQPYGAPDYGWGHAGYPVISVARQAAQAFAEWLSKKTGKKYRLPTEAEWVHAASLGTGKDPMTAARLDGLAWHSGNASARTHPVATKAADALGLHDLFGNAAEWVMADLAGGAGDEAAVTRGGSFRDTPDTIAAGARAIQDDSWNERDPQLPKSRWWLSDGPFVGFRVVREP
jgi:formylglycine-generating enzyme required for sulfatase activity